ncbi:DNA repair protein rad9, partial [Smittium culicis]
MGTFKQRGTSPDKAVEKCVVKIEENSYNRSSIQKDSAGKDVSFECRLVVSIYQKAGVVKTYKMIFEQTDTLHAVYDKSACSNRFVIDPKLLKDTINHFPRQLDEISFLTTEKNVLIRSWASGALISDSNIAYGDNQANTANRGIFGANGSLAGDSNRTMQTELIMESEEFDLFVIETNQKSQDPSLNDFLFTELTFGLREFKSILQYAEAANAPLQAFFDNGGDPILISISEDQFDLNSKLGANTTRPRKKKRPENNSYGYNSSNNSNISGFSSKEINIDGVNAEFVLATVSDSTLSNQHTSQSSLQSIKRIVKQYTESQLASQKRSQPNDDKFANANFSQTQTQTQPLSPTTKNQKANSQVSQSSHLIENIFNPNLSNSQSSNNHNAFDPSLDDKENTRKISIQKLVDLKSRFKSAADEQVSSNILNADSRANNISNIIDSFKKNPQLSTISRDPIEIDTSNNLPENPLQIDPPVFINHNVKILDKGNNLNIPPIPKSLPNTNQDYSSDFSLINNNIDSENLEDANDSMLRTPNSLNPNYKEYDNNFTSINASVSNMDGRELDASKNTNSSAHKIQDNIPYYLPQKNDDQNTDTNTSSQLNTTNALKRPILLKKGGNSIILSDSPESQPSDSSKISHENINAPTYLSINTANNNNKHISNNQNDSKKKTTFTIFGSDHSSS